MQPTAIQIVKTLQKAGYEAHFAGGCVRDLLLKHEPKDFDIVTSAKPDEIEKLLKKTIPVGKKFGVILAIKNGHHFEVATFRSDSGYSDGRRPDAVTFTTSKEDAFRRDFTINGIFYDPVAKKIIDYVGGQKDLEARLIRFIGNPHERILEDHLRILRAVRFKNVLDFQYEPSTYTALHKHASLLIDKVSAERIRDELNKMILSKNAVAALQDLEDIGALKIILPEIEKMKGVAQPYQYHQEGDVWTHAMQALGSLPDDAPLTLRWATLLHDIGKPETFKLAERIRFDHHDRASRDIARKILTRLHCENKLIDEVCWLVEHHMTVIAFAKMSAGRRMHWFLHPYFPNLLRLFEADAKGTTPQHLEFLEDLKKLFKSSIKKMPHPPPPLLHGQDIMKILKIPAGPRVGEVLEQLREKQLGGELKTKKQALTWLELIGN